MTRIRSENSSSSSGLSQMPQSEEAKRLFLRIRRHQLLAPVHAILDLVGDLLNAEKIQNHEKFRDDVLLVREYARKLERMITELMDYDMSKASESDRNDRISHHDLRSALTVLIGYSEDLHLFAPEVFLDGFGQELEHIQELGHQLTLLIDEVATILKGDSTRSKSETEIEIITTEIIKAKENEHDALTGRLLIVDDHPIIRSRLELRAKQEGHDTVAVGDGEAALNILRENPTGFDLVLLDLVMPRVNGFQVLTEMKNDAELRNIPVIVISGLGEQSEIVSCIEMGAEDFLTKPFNPVLLRARVQACLEKKRLRDEAERERKRYDMLLHDILPAPIVDALATDGEVPPKRHENVAVLFADLVGFTTYCDKMSPESVVGDLQELFIVWEEIANNCGVQKIKTIGDAFMAASGLVISTTTDPVQNCVECGFQMIKAVQQHRSGWNLRVGVHAGPVVAAVLGKRQYLYDLWGDSVNTAARMESNGKPGCVNLTLEAWSRVADLYPGLDSWEIKNIKGKGAMQIISVHPRN